MRRWYLSDYAVILAARATSERFPNKVLAHYIPNSDMTNLEQIARRWQMSRREPRLIILTPTGAANEPIAQLAARLGLPCYRGSDTNVTGSMDAALRAYANDARWVARAMADNPLVDVGLADHRLDRLADTGADGFDIDEADVARLTYAATTDVWSRAAWDRIAAESSGEELEHPGAFYWHSIAKFNAIPYPLPSREYFAPVRTELDEPDDLAMFDELWKVVYPGELYPCVNTLTALECLIDMPHIAAINAAVALKTQSKAEWRKGSTFRCKHCDRRIASIIAGDLLLPCRHCGHPQKFYANPPAPNPYRRDKKPSTLSY